MVKKITDIKLGSVMDRYIKFIRRFDRVMLYIEIVCIPLKELKTLQENQIDIINMMETRGMTSFCQAIELNNGQVYFDTYVIDPKDNDHIVEDVYTFLNKLTSIIPDANELENKLSHQLNCEVASKVTAIDVVVKINNNVRRYKVEEFMRIANNSNK